MYRGVGAKQEIALKFAIGRQTGSDPLVIVTVFAKTGETVTKSISLEAARELAIRLMQAAQ